MWGASTFPRRRRTPLTFPRRRHAPRRRADAPHGELPGGGARSRTGGRPSESFLNVMEEELEVHDVVYRAPALLGTPEVEGFGRTVWACGTTSSWDNRRTGWPSSLACSRAWDGVQGLKSQAARARANDESSGSGRGLPRRRRRRLGFAAHRYLFEADRRRRKEHSSGDQADEPARPQGLLRVEQRAWVRRSRRDERSHRPAQQGTRGGSFECRASVAQ